MNYKILARVSLVLVIAVLLIIAYLYANPNVGTSWTLDWRPINGNCFDVKLGYNASKQSNTVETRTQWDVKRKECEKWVKLPNEVKSPPAPYYAHDRWCKAGGRPRCYNVP